MASGLRVQVQALSWTPPGASDQRPILDEIDLTVPAGEFLAIVGPNGAGKSSLLSAMAGEEVRPTKGQVLVGNEVVTSAINRRIDGVGVVHQNPNDDLVLNYSIAMNVAMRQQNNGCHPHRIWACSQAYRTWLALKLARIAPRLGRGVETLVDRLSGGEKQQLNLAIAAHLEHTNNPAGLILLDEHTAGLDHKNSRVVMEYTTALVKETGCTAIMVSHRYHDIAPHCDRVLILRRGRVHGYLSSDDNGGLNPDRIRDAVDGEP